MTLPARPSAPTGLDTKYETTAGAGDGQITGVTNAMEYSADGVTWSACTGDAVTGLSAGVYSVRYAATGTSFAGSAEAVTVSVTPTYDLTVTVPVFDAVTYGYAQPQARSITITSTGNSASAISSVALSGPNASAFTLNGPDNGVTVQPSQSDTSYTIQPAAGLNVGTYTATITVTYQDSETVTAGVSFTVKKDGASLSLNTYRGEEQTSTFTYGDTLRSRARLPHPARPAASAPDSGGTDAKPSGAVPG